MNFGNASGFGEVVMPCVSVAIDSFPRNERDMLLPLDLTLIAMFDGYLFAHVSLFAPVLSGPSQW